MKSKMIKGIFWGGIIASLILAMNVFHFLFGCLNVLAAGPHGHGHRGMGPHGGFESNPMMGYQHNGFSWIGSLLVLILVIAALVLIVKWLRRNSKEAAMQQFIDTSLSSSYRPVSNQNGNILDQWEKSLINKKEKG